MEEYKDSNHDEYGWAALRDGSNRWLAILVVALLAITGVAFAYGYHQKSELSQATAQAATANAAMTQMQSQVNSLTAKLNELSAAQTPPPATPPASASVVSADVVPQSSEAPPTPEAKPKQVHPRHRVIKHRAPAVDKKYLELQAQLADQQKQLKETQDEVAKDRSDLESSINSTRDDLNSTRDNLNGSIARTHDELVALEKRGERAYFEFDLSKSKQFERVGPISISLRKADAKHEHYNLAMMIDDNELQKKNVNLYEPVWIHTENDSQPVQIVVNKISKDHIHGYISAPKYKPSELAAAASASVTPVSAKAPASASSTTPDPEQPQPQKP
jgi:type II secretory pathway pseudopilin PulG